MAKKTESVDEELSSLEKELKKKYGDSIISLGTEILSEVKMVLPISPSMDSIIGGGVPEGSWVGLAGPSGCGKTTLALTLAANAQKEEFGSREVFYIDAEGRLKRKNLEGIFGLNAAKVKVIRSTREKHLSGEEFSSIATNIVKAHERAVIIIDSVSSMCPSAEITEDVSGQIRSTSPRIMASFCRLNAGVVPVMNTIVITIHHLINNTSGYGEKLMLDGGVKIGYQADVKLITKGKPEKWMADGKQIGQISEWECLKAAIGAPHGTASTYIRYGMGIDAVVEVVNMAIELGIIEKAGAWFRLPFVSDDTKFQGQEKVNNFVSSKPELIVTIKGKIMEMQ
jgi:recombination protein RecA